MTSAVSILSEVLGMSMSLSKEQIEDLIEYCGSRPTIWKDEDMLICCPVHGEVHPSCGVSADKQIFHCFACGASGNFVKMLYMSRPDDFGYDNSTKEAEKKTWFKADRRARQFLKDRYELEYRELGSRTRLVRRFDEVRSRIIDIEEKEETLPLWKIAPYQSGKMTYKYFFDRGFDKEDLKKYMIGYDDVNKTVTIPVFTADNKLVGVIGRYISKKRRKNQRYKIYDGFNRSQYLYPLNHFKVIDSTIILVEGQFDAIWCHKCGLTNTLAIMTDQLSREQLDFISNNCSRVIYIGDNDERGLEMREKNGKALKNLVDFFIVDFPDHGKDPCDWSEEELHDMVNNAHSIVNRKLRRL